MENMDLPGKKQVDSMESLIEISKVQELTTRLVSISEFAMEFYLKHAGPDCFDLDLMYRAVAIGEQIHDYLAEYTKRRTKEELESLKKA